jgi:hypothetical protein
MDVNVHPRKARDRTSPSTNARGHSTSVHSHLNLKPPHAPSLKSLPNNLKKGKCGCANPGVRGVPRVLPGRRHRRGATLEFATETREELLYQGKAARQRRPMGKSDRRQYRGQSAPSLRSAAARSRSGVWRAQSNSMPPLPVDATCRSASSREHTSSPRRGTAS